MDLFRCSGPARRSMSGKQHIHPPAKDNLVIYELLVRDFVAAHDFKTIRDTLDYLNRLGVNAIEFMPVTSLTATAAGDITLQCILQLTSITVRLTALKN